jgi:hypothetical protein
MGKTYFIDVDGTIVKHLSNDDLNKILNEEHKYKEELLPGVKELWKTFGEDDCIIITTAREELKHKAMTEKIFKENGLRYNQMIFNLPCGPRVVINDTPDIMFKKAIAINVMRNGGFYFDKNAESEIP